MYSRRSIKLRFSSSTIRIFQNCRPVSLPHHRVSQTHRASPPLLLGLVPIYVSDARPAPGSRGAHSPLGVVLAGLEIERLSWVYESDVQDLPSQRAVRREDPGGTNPELHQEV